MKKMFTLVLALTFIPFFSQTVEWENVYENNLTLGKSLKIDNSKNTISVSNGFNQSGFAEYLYIHKINDQGNTIWKDSVSTGISNNYHAATWVGTDSDDNIFVVGYQFTLSLQNEFLNALKVFKFSPAGDLLINKTIPGNFNSGANYNLGVKNESFLDESNNLYIATAGNTSNQTESGLVLLKLDNNCNTLWERVKNFSTIHGLKGMNYKNGNIALIGNTTISLSENKTVVWDSNGNLKWSSSNSLANQSWATDVLLDDIGNTYTLCQKFGTTNTEIEITKYNNIGDVLYRQSYNIGVESTSGRMAMLPNGTIVLTGTNWSSSGNGKLFVANVSALDGIIINSNEYLLPNINNWVYDIKVGVTGNYYIVGKSDNNGGAPATMFVYAFINNNTLAWNTTYNTQGTLPMALGLDDSENLYVAVENKNAVVKFGNSIVLNNETFDHSESFVVYPNPAAEYLNINNLEKVKSSAIVNSMGIIVNEISDSTNPLYIGNLSNGMYFLRLTLENGSIVNTKFFKK